jgi:hypothetical protein
MKKNDALFHFSHKGSLIALLIFTAPVSWAIPDCSNYLPQVSLQLSAEEWVTSQTAKVTISLDALLNRQQLANAQENFQSALSQIAPEGVWHITEFSRSASKTNLEQLHVVAEARLSDKAMAGLRERAHALNSEGQTYTIQDITYSPTMQDVSAAQARLRSQIYSQAKAEIDRLNAIYPKPGFILYNINFTNFTAQPGPLMNKTMMTAMARETPSPTMSQQMTQDALVVLASPAGPCESSSAANK